MADPASLVRRLAAACTAVLIAGVALVAAPGEAAAARPRVLLLGDSTLAALAWYSSSQSELRGLNYTLEAASCRAVTAVSCVGRTDANGRRIRPANAADVLRSYGAGAFDELVLMVGYDESYETFKRSVVALPRLAADLGIDHITWLTFRTGVSYDAPTTVSYLGNNRLLRAAASSSGGYIDLVDWNGYVSAVSGLVEADGVHLTSKGASHTASLIRQAVISHWGSGATNASSAGSASSGSKSNSVSGLAYGATGDSVKELQRLLLAVGSDALAPYGATGRFFAVTERAVKDFQQLVKSRHDASMVVDGIAGSVTMRWLRQLAPSGAGAASKASAGAAGTSGSGQRVALSYGVVGAPVEELQAILLRIGSEALAPYGVTGKYYAVTRTAVREFQEMVRRRHDSSMVVDGIVGSVTWRWLDELDPG